MLDDEGRFLFFAGGIVCSTIVVAVVVTTV